MSDFAGSREIAERLYQEMPLVRDQLPEVSRGVLDSISTWGGDMWPNTTGPTWDELIDGPVAAGDSVDAKPYPPGKLIAPGLSDFRRAPGSASGSAGEAGVTGKGYDHRRFRLPGYTSALRCQTDDCALEATITKVEGPRIQSVGRLGVVADTLTSSPAALTVEIGRFGAEADSARVRLWQRDQPGAEAVMVAEKLLAPPVRLRIEAGTPLGSAVSDVKVLSAPSAGAPYEALYTWTGGPLPEHPYLTAGAWSRATGTAATISFETYSVTR